MNVEILIVKAVRWPGNGKCTRNNGMEYSGNDSYEAHPHGVGIVLSKGKKGENTNVKL